MHENKTLDEELETLFSHATCCYTEAQLRDLIRRVRSSALAEGKRQGWNACADCVSDVAETARDNNPYMKGVS